MSKAYTMEVMQCSECPACTDDMSRCMEAGKDFEEGYWLTLDNDFPAWCPLREDNPREPVAYNTNYEILK